MQSSKEKVDGQDDQTATREGKVQHLQNRQNNSRSQWYVSTLVLRTQVAQPRPDPVIDVYHRVKQNHRVGFSGHFGLLSDVLYPLE